jgi:hypothetical protein
VDDGKPPDGLREQALAKLDAAIKRLSDGKPSWGLRRQGWTTENMNLMADELSGYAEQIRSNQPFGPHDGANAGVSFDYLGVRARKDDDLKTVVREAVEAYNGLVRQSR